MLILIVLLVVVYAVGQWLIFTTLDAKFSALEQRVVDNTDRLDTKITDVEQTVIEATKVLKAAALAAPARAPEPKNEDTTVEPAAPEKPAASAAAAPATPPAPAAAPAKPAAPAPAQ
jgi:hypothetical protein